MNVFILAAMTADGYIGRDANHLANWTSHEDKKRFVRLTKDAGVIVFGSKTFATIGHALPDRRMIVYTSRPETIADPDVEATSEAPDILVKRLETEGCKGVAICGGASIYDQFMRSGVVHELYLTIEPLLFGAGVTLFTEPLTHDLELAESIATDEGSLLLHYRVKH